jgi:hypothetical protein
MVDVAQSSCVHGRGRRSRGLVPRLHVVKVKLSDAEKTALDAAAERAGLALGAFIARAGLDAAEYQAVPVGAAQREALGELIRVAGLVRRAGVNLNVRHEVAHVKWMRRRRSLMVT